MGQAGAAGGPGEEESIVAMARELVEVRERAAAAERELERLRGEEAIAMEALGERQMRVVELERQVADLEETCNEMRKVTATRVGWLLCDEIWEPTARRHDKGDDCYARSGELITYSRP